MASSLFSSAAEFWICHYSLNVFLKNSKDGRRRYEIVLRELKEKIFTLSEGQSKQTFNLKVKFPFRNQRLLWRMSDISKNDHYCFFFSSCLDSLCLLNSSMLMDFYEQLMEWRKVVCTSNSYTTYLFIFSCTVFIEFLCSPLWFYLCKVLTTWEYTSGLFHHASVIPLLLPYYYYLHFYITFAPLFKPLVWLEYQHAL